MKLAVTILFLVLAALVGAQTTTDGVIKATVTMLGDGRHKSMVVNPDTHLAEETIEDKKGKVLSRTTYQLDERNLPHSATFFDAKGKVLYKAAFKRDAGDRIIEENYTSPAGQSLGRRVYAYGANNRVAQLDVYDASGNLVTPQKPASRGRPDKKKR